MRQMRWIGVVGDADELRSVDFSRGLGATTKRNEICSHKNWK